jgi:predicted metalloprotease with PDZ domain
MSSPEMTYTLSIPEPEKGTFDVELKTRGWVKDTLHLKLPQWSPGYYQIMNYYKHVQDFEVEDAHGNPVEWLQVKENSWSIPGIREKSLTIRYSIKTERKFVATSFVDATHAYLVPAGTFMYVEDHLKLPVKVSILKNPNWIDIATGLDEIPGEGNNYRAADFDVLYDCPILIGNLERLPPFEVKGIPHNFIGYDLGSFDKEGFMKSLERVVTSAVAIIGHIPFDNYSFIAIGPGRGGIEHLNNTTISFTGNGLNSESGKIRMLNFLAHEYFHHYNVKRIRPFELGPFDYEKGSRTNLLWFSEGLTVYYEYLILRRADLMDESSLFDFLESHINGLENNPGRKHQSLVQASYNTWSDGPFGRRGGDRGKTISVYQKGAVFGLLLDFAIREASANEKSLDDVMRYLYYNYYLNENRGFTDSEVQNACERIAGTSFSNLFEYVYTTEDLDYNRYLNAGGLYLDQSVDSDDKDASKKEFKIRKMKNPNALQVEILNSWQGRR